MPSIDPNLKPNVLDYRSAQSSDDTGESPFSVVVPFVLGSATGAFACSLAMALLGDLRLNLYFLLEVSYGVAFINGLFAAVGIAFGILIRNRRADPRALVPRKRLAFPAGILMAIFALAATVGAAQPGFLWGGSDGGLIGFYAVIQIVLSIFASIGLLFRADPQ